MNFAPWILLVLVLISGFAIGHTIGKETLDYLTRQPSIIDDDGRLKQVTMHADLVGVLNDQYYLGEHEFLYCLKATETSEGILINEMKPATIINKNMTNVNGACNELTTYGTVHPHLNGQCLPSYLDVYTYGWIGHNILVIMCGQNQFYYYTPYNLDQGMLINIGG